MDDQPAFVPRQSEQAFFQDRVAPVPEGQRETDKLVAIRNAGQSFFVPSIGLRAGMVMGQELPGRSIGTIVFADRSPGPFAEVRAPPLPMFPAEVIVIEALLFS